MHAYCIHAIAVSILKVMFAGRKQVSVLQRQRTITYISAPSAIMMHNSVATSMAPVAGTVRRFKPDEDKEAAAQACETIAQAMTGSCGDEMFSPSPDMHLPRWRGIVSNITLRLADRPVLFALPDYESAAVAYPYPEFSAPEGAPPPPGTIDLAPFSRLEAQPIRDEFFAWLGEQKKSFLEEHGPFFYLCFIGTKPELQGKGYGSQLLQSLGRLADVDSKWSYLEASSEGSRRMYKRHGFQDLGQRSWVPKEAGMDIPGRMDIFLMGRPPRLHEQ